MTKIIKLVEEKQMCSLPWVHTEVDLQNNTIKPCCKYESNFGSASENFTNVWMNQYAQQLRKDWINNTSHEHCKPCYVSDDSFSYKKWKNKHYSTQFNFLSTTEAEKPSTPSVFHLTLSNTCNLACRMCDSGNSSKLAQMTRKHQKLQKYLTLLPHTRAVDPETLRGSFKNAEQITFAGGEPLIDENTIKVIEMIKEESTNLKLVNFSTNLTIINDSILEMLSSMSVAIALSISIDGPEHIHEYIRYHCSWETMMNNISYIRKKYPKIFLSVNSTISVLNVGYVTDMLDSVQEIQNKHDARFRSIMTSPVLNKRHLHPGILPQELKDHYLRKIKSYQNTCNIKDSNFLIPTAIDMLSKNIDGEIENFVDYITEFDSIAGTSVLDVYPEFKYILQ